MKRIGMVIFAVGTLGMPGASPASHASPACSVREVRAAQGAKSTPSPEAPPSAQDAPAGGRTLRVVTLRSFAAFSGLFSLTQGAVRIVALVSSRSPRARSEIDAIRSVFAAVTDRRLRGYVILAPADTAARAYPPALQALSLVRPNDDARIQFFWDPDHLVVTALAAIDSTICARKDQFLLYDIGAVYGSEPASHVARIRRPASRADTDSTLHAHTDPDTILLIRRARALLDAYARERRAARGLAPGP